MTAARRIRLLLLVSWLLLAGLATRLYALQVARHDELSEKAERRRRRVELLMPRRGRILDRKGRALVLDRTALDVVVELPELDPTLELVRSLAWATKRPIDEVARAFRDARARVREGAPSAVVGRAGDSLTRDRVRKVAARVHALTVVPAEGGFEVLATAELVGARDRALDRLGTLVGADPDGLRSTVQLHEDEVRSIEDHYLRLRAWGDPIVVARDVSFDTAAAVEEASTTVPGLGVLRRHARAYPNGPLAAHVLGYLGAPGEADLARLRHDGLLVEDAEEAALLGSVRELAPGTRSRKQLVGRAGLEARQDRVLAGTPGLRVVERDASCRTRETLVSIAPEDGADVTLTLDLELQAAAEAALDEALAKHGEPGRAGGAAVLVSVETGEVLALASAPRYDPNAIGRTLAALLLDPARPLLPRAVEPAPPGSTFKALSALAFFGGDGGLAPGTTFCCEGALEPGKKGSHFHCDAVHGPSVGLEQAIAQSCNVFFFRAADATEDATRLATWAERAGFGRLASGSIPLECRGSFPDPTGKRRHYGPGDRRNAAIGQGDVLATPLQVARLAALVATGGREVRARFLATDEPDEERIDLDPRVLEIVREGLAGCVRRGTASGRSIGLRDLDVSGKTGTAERRSGEPNYAWFMGYYPASRPEVAFAALVDRTGAHGGNVCGPIARALVAAYARSKGEEPKRR